MSGLVLILASAAQAQISFNMTIAPPPWGPVGYNQVQYYYLPDVESYYDVQSSMFIYYAGGTWVHRSYLPPRYKNYDLYGGYKVVMTDYHGNTPYTHFKEHKTKYGKNYYHGKPQRTIGERPGDGSHGHNGGHGDGKHDGNNHDKGDKHGNNKNDHGNGEGKKK